AQDRLRIALDGVDHDLVLIDCPPSLGLLTVNGLFAADRALVVTEPAAWARDGVEQVMRTIERVSARRSAPLDVAGVVVNRLGRTRDAKYWYEQLQGDYADLVLPAIQMRAAVTEASAQSTSLYALGKRAGALEAAAQFEALLESVLPSGAPTNAATTTTEEPEAIATYGSVQAGPVGAANERASGDSDPSDADATPDSMPAAPEEMSNERVRPPTVAISTTPS
ncbi:MAG: ParA family protein, partial [Ilumatobacteraceae bacterium]